MIDINITLLIQLVNFIIALVGMNYLLIKPVRAIVKERRDIASGLLRDTEEFAANASAKLETYERTLAEAREEASRIRQADKENALARESGILESAQKDAQEFLRSSREETRAAVRRAMDEMRGRIPALADQAAGRLLGAPAPKAKPRKAGR